MSAMPAQFVSEGWSADAVFQGNSVPLLQHESSRQVAPGSGAQGNTGEYRRIPEGASPGRRRVICRKWRAHERSASAVLTLTPGHVVRTYRKLPCVNGGFVISGLRCPIGLRDAMNTVPKLGARSLATVRDSREGRGQKTWQDCVG
jgi:hypothetical protein